MKKMQNKTEYMLKAGIILLLFCLLSVMFVSCDRGGEEETSAPVQTSEITPETTVPEDDETVISCDGKILFRYSDMTVNTFEASEGRTVKYLRTGDGPDFGIIRIDYESGESQTETVTGKSLEFALKHSGSACVSFTTEIDGKTVYIVSSGAFFKEICENSEYTDCIAEQLCDISIDGDIKITHPFYWSTAGHYFTCGNLVFESDAAGNMTIDNANESDIACDSLLCDTPLWDFTVKIKFSDFREAVFGRINVKTLNGTEPDRTAVCIRSTEDFERFTSGAFGEYLAEAKTVFFSGDMELPSFTLKNIELLTFSGNVVLAEGAEIFSVGDKLTVDSVACTSDISGSLGIFAPDADLVWQGANAPDYDYAEQFFEVKSFNGESLDSSLGGSGGAVALSVKAGETEGQIAGRYITLYTSYSSTLDFSNAVFEITVSEGASYAISASATGRHYLTVTDSSGGKYCYLLRIQQKLNNLPVIYLTTNDGKSITSKYTYVAGTFSIDYNGCSDESNITGAAMTVRGRGHSSWEMAKKPYLVKFDTKTSLFGLTKAKDWVLQANHADYSLIRNKLASDISQVLDGMPFTPHSYMVDLFLNGTYVGVYTLTERVETGDGRIEIEENSTETDTDYLLELQGELANTSWGGINIFTTKLCYYTEIKNPEPDVLTKAQYNYIYSYITKVDKAVMALKDYEQYFDLDSMIDWFILTELSYNTDGAMHRSVFFVKTKGEDGKIVFTAPWDFDYGFGNIYFTSNYEEWICLGSNASLDKYPESHDGRKYIRTNWFNYLLQDPAFKAKLKARWNEIKDDVYKAATDSLETVSSTVALSAADNFNVWKNVLGRRIQYQASNVYKIKTWEGQVEYLKAFIEHRYNWMDSEINSY